ncbi:hypothetical protein [Dickeya dianthicola]|nr:hypothetical protein [Dickeya dianthicola]MBT1430714.1 hypothetical protein [Dickeya dianthicola]MZG45519.1 hypothetical protein [Dickeya dianthicola]MZH99850.1 hypothetical protein [Dickeya dianthicola]
MRSYLGVAEFSSIAVNTSPQTKINKIKSIANRPEYHPGKDFYKKIRDAIKRLIVKKGHISELYDLCRKEKNSSKKIYFEKIVNVFNEWQSGKNITGFPAPKRYYHYAKTDISCNPELNVNFQGRSKLVKLHFSNSEKMTQERANFICFLMERAIGDQGFEYSVLDLTSGKEFFFSGNKEKQEIRVNKEIQFIEAHWED